MESFENIYLDISKQPGKCRVAEAGIGWKPSGGGDNQTLEKGQIGQAQWSRASKGYELKIISRASGIMQFDGFQEDDLERLTKAFKIWYGINLEQKEHALRGWNWGKGEFGKAELTFTVQNRPAFEIPYSEIANTNLTGKTEVAVDFALPGEGEANGDGLKAKGKKGGGARDQLVEARFYIPGTVLKKEKKEGEQKEDGEEGSEDGEEDVEEQNAANMWYETLLEKADVSDVTGDSIAAFLDILHLTPRGRFDLDMYENSFRLRGKTYDYKIQYDSVKKVFLLPKPDDLHHIIAIGLDPPLRQGQTRYPFLVMQFKNDDDVELDLNLKDEDMAEGGKYNSKLRANYSGPIYIVLENLFRGLVGKKVVKPSKDFSSRHSQQGIKCAIKANEGHLYCMDKMFMFVPKPATYISMEQIQQVVLSRVGGAVSASRTFDITMTLKNKGGEHQFSNINREEQEPLEDFFRAKGLKVRNEMAEDSALLTAALKEQALDSSEDEVLQAARGSADEDSESADEDFQADSDSDPAEEYDSDHESSGAGSDAEMHDANGDADGDADEDGDTAEKVERPKKKTKTAK